MVIKKYIVRTTIFVVFLMWFVIFMTFFIFSSIRYYRIYKSALENLGEYTDLIINIKDFSGKIENVVSDYIVKYTLGEKINLKHFFKQEIGVPYIVIYTPDNGVFGSFDEERCKKDFVCKYFTNGKYRVIVGFKLRYPQYMYINDIEKFLIFSFLISLLLSVFTYFILKKIFRPLEENIIFMKNFVNIAGHEFKTPLTNINLAAQLLKKDYNQQLIDDIINETKRLTNLINGLLKLAILGKERLKQKNLNICKIFDLLKKDLDFSNVEIKGDCFNVFGDENHIVMVLKNLLENALKYSFEGEKVIVGLDGRKKIVCISNKGPEIKDKNKIFDLFYKENVSSQGFGIGLALVKKVCEINGWKIKVDRKNGINTFCVYF